MGKFKTLSTGYQNIDETSRLNHQQCDLSFFFCETIRNDLIPSRKELSYYLRLAKAAYLVIHKERIDDLKILLKPYGRNYIDFSHCSRTKSKILDKN